MNAPGLIQVFVAGDPKPKGSLRHVGGGRLIEQVAGSKAWREAIVIAAAQERDRQGWQTLAGCPVAVTARVTVKRPASVSRETPFTRSSGDVDKLARNILDAITDAHLIGDDSQVTDLYITKEYGPNPGVWITLWTAPEAIREGVES